MSERECNAAEERIRKLNTALVALSTDTSVSARFILLNPDGVGISQGALSARDLDAAIAALDAINGARKATEEAASPDMQSLPYDDGDIKDAMNALEDLANGEL